jgi:hypothetical protein
MADQAERAIVTLAIGELFEEMGKITHPLMREYAGRCNADFIVITAPHLGHLGRFTYEKFQLYSLLDIYDRIIFIDTDILVSKDSPNLFDVVPRDHFGAASETTYSQAPVHQRITQEELGPIDWKYPYFNSGMMIFSRAHKEVFDPNDPKLARWATDEVRTRYNLLGSDQPYLNYRVNELGVPFVDVGFRFNHTRAIRETQYRFQSHFIHHSGPSGHRYGTKLHQLSKDAGVLGNPFLLRLSQRIPAYRWIADRLDWGFVEYLLFEKFGKRKP